MNIPKVLGTTFFTEQIRWLLYILVSESFLKKKVIGEIAFDLSSLFHVQTQEPKKAGQLPREHLSFLQSLLNFIITKYLKKEFDDDLSVGMDERSSCSLSVT